MKDQPDLFYEFDKFCVEPAERRVLYADQIVPLTPKAFDTLIVLLENRGKIIDKDLFLDKVWNDTFVEESTLAQNIFTLRKALRFFTNDKTFIETIPRRGYRFVGDVREIAGEEEIVVLERRHQTHIIAEQTEIGDVPEWRLKAWIKDHIFGAVSIAVAVLAVFFVWQYLLRPAPLIQTKFQTFDVQNIASGADIRLAAISPDGRYVAFVDMAGERETLRLKQIASGNVIEVAGSADAAIIGAVFSPDSSEIYYTAYNREPDASPRIGNLYKVPLFGGPSQQILKDIDSPVAISLDGKQIAFIRNDPAENETALMVADFDGQSERQLAVRKFGAGFAFSKPAWSPDGKFVSCSAKTEKTDQSMELVIVDVLSGGQRSLTPQNDWMWVGASEWMSDGSGIAVVAYGSKSPNLTDEIWFVSYPEGNARLITNGVNGLSGISLATDGNSLIAAKLSRITGFYTASLDNMEQAREIATNIDSESLLQLGADFIPDGRIVYSQTQNGNADIWIMNADGSAKTQLTADASADFMPTAASDGRSIIFLSNRENSTAVWQADLTGANTKRISKKSNLYSPELSPDGRWIYYAAEDENFRKNIWKEPIGGGEPIKLTNGIAFAPKLSLDGKTIACLFSESRKPPQLTLFSAEDGRILRHFDLPSKNRPLYEWSADNRSLYVFSDGLQGSTLSRLGVADAKVQKIKQWQGRVFRFAISSDEQQIFYEMGKEATTILHLQDK